MINPLQLLKLANNGNKEAYKELLGWLATHAFSQIKMNLRKYHQFPAQSIDDIVQDVLIAFHQTHQSFDMQKPFMPWLNSMIRYKSIDFIRRKEFRTTMTAVEIAAIEDLWSIDEDEDSDLLLEILESLPEDQCNLLKMAKVEGCTGKEISLRLNISESNVKVMIHRAVKELKRLSSSAKYKKP